MTNWSITPKFALRRDCVRRVTRTWTPGKFVEIGAGTGALTSLFVDEGYAGTCYDLGAANRDVLRERFRSCADRVRVADHLDELPHQGFDYLFAFEVLEHIEDDLGALQAWGALLRPGGRLLISVPAHRRKYGPEDEAVGHVRRYEKADLMQLLDSAGFGEIRIANYGFPLAPLSRVVSNRIYRNAQPHDEPAVERSMRSGIERPEAVNRWAPWFRSWVLQPFCWMQRPFLRRDWGDGYVVTAVRAADDAREPVRR